jgi:hypothetical protein
MLIPNVALFHAKPGANHENPIFSFMLWIIVFAIALLRSQKGQEALPEVTPEFARASSANR